MSLEDLVNKFVLLSKKPILTKLDHEGSKKLMIELRKAGMSNAEIAELSGGKWSIPTIKGYTVGVKMDKHGEWPSAVSAITGLISKGISLDQVQWSIEINEGLKVAKVGLEEIVEMIEIMDSTSTDMAGFIHWMQEMHQAGLTVADIKAGVELKAASKHLQELEAESASFDHKLQETQVKIADLDKVLLALEKIEKLGFDEKDLNDIAELSQKYGGPGAVFQTLKGYEDYQAIEKKNLAAKAELSSIQSDIKKTNAQTSHLLSAIDMCQTLMSKYKTGIDAIKLILQTAEKFGNATEILKAVDSYGKLKEIEARVNALQGEENSLGQHISTLKGEYKQCLDDLESLHSKALQIGAEVGKVEGELAASNEVKKLLNILNSSQIAGYSEYAPNMMILAFAIKQWVSAHTDKFRYSSIILEGLGSLMTDLGGLQ